MYVIEKGEDDGEIKWESKCGNEGNFELEV